MADIFYIKRNDTSPAIAQQLLNGSGVAVDLTGASVRFHMSSSAGVLIVDAAATIDVAATGMVSYQWQAADTALSGTFSQEWEVTYAGGRIETFPNNKHNTIVITKDLS